LKSIRISTSVDNKKHLWNWKYSWYWTTYEYYSIYFYNAAVTSVGVALRYIVFFNKKIICFSI